MVVGYPPYLASRAPMFRTLKKKGCSAGGLASQALRRARVEAAGAAELGAQPGGAMLPTPYHPHSPWEMYTYLDEQNSQQGPYSLDQLFSWCAAGHMPQTTRVRPATHAFHLDGFQALLYVPGFSVYMRQKMQTWPSNM